MISKAHRFHGHNSLSFVYKQGKTARSSLCMVRVAPNSRRSSYRAAVVVSKKLSKSAVVRNRIRRRLYAALRAAVGQGVVPAVGYDIVITATNLQVAVIAEKELNKTIYSLLQTLVRGQGGGGEVHSPANR